MATGEGAGDGPRVATNSEPQQPQSRLGVLGTVSGTADEVKRTIAGGSSPSSSRLPNFSLTERKKGTHGPSTYMSRE